MFRKCVNGVRPNEIGIFMVKTTACFSAVNMELGVWASAFCVTMWKVTGKASRIHFDIVLNLMAFSFYRFFHSIPFHSIWTKKAQKKEKKIIPKWNRIVERGKDAFNESIYGINGVICCYYWRKKKYTEYKECYKYQAWYLFAHINIPLPTVASWNCNVFHFHLFHSHSVA